MLGGGKIFQPTVGGDKEMLLFRLRKKPTKTLPKTESNYRQYLVTTDLKGHFERKGILVPRWTVQLELWDDRNAYRKLRRRFLQLGGKDITLRLEPLDQCLIGTLPVKTDGQVVPASPPSRDTPRPVEILVKFRSEAIAKVSKQPHVVAVEEYKRRDHSIRKLSSWEQLYDYLRILSRSD